MADLGAEDKGMAELGGAFESGEITVKLESGGSRKARGRPLGSKNKARAPIMISKESQSGLKSVVIEISGGSDVVESLVHYARSRRVGISVLSASGSVSTVTLRQPMLHPPAPAMSLHGPFFNLLSLSGSFMESSTLTLMNSFGICLAGSQGQVFGGIVAGEVIAASLVVVVAATFNKPRFHKLPADPDAVDQSDDDDHDPTMDSFLLGGNLVLSSGSGSTCAAAMSTCLSPHHDQLVLPSDPLLPHY